MLGDLGGGGRWQSIQGSGGVFCLSCWILLEGSSLQCRSLGVGSFGPGRCLGPLRVDLGRQLRESVIESSLQGAGVWESEFSDNITYILRTCGIQVRK
jgi:hypothetical protein